MTAIDLAKTADAAGYLEKARALREEFAKTAPALDASGKPPSENLHRLYEEGFYRLCVPAAQGGDGGSDLYTDNLALVMDIITEIAAAEPATAQIWMCDYINARTIFYPLVDASEEVKARIAGEILAGRGRMGVGASEHGKDILDWSTTGRRVDGGVVVNGTKAFTTGHDGANYLLTWVVMEGATSFFDAIQMMLIDLSSVGITDHRDWDNMGQKGTASGRITFNEVFVPETNMVGPVGACTNPEGIFGVTMQLCFAAIYVGMADGALEAASDYVRTTTRPWPTAGVESAIDDQYIQWQAGNVSILVEGARLLVREAAEGAIRFERGETSRGEASVQTARAKAASTHAALTAGQDLFRMAGARATSNKYRLDRFWRNARTLTLHDPVDRRIQDVGRYVLTGTPPLPTFYS